MCIACCKEGDKACSRCKACYCSVECQRKHWPMHQKDCGRPTAAQQDAKALTNGGSSRKPGKRSHGSYEEELLVELDGCNLEDDVIFNIDEITPQPELQKKSKVVVYIVENLLMKGQAIDAKETEKFLSLMQELNQNFHENRHPIDASNCREGALVMFDYQGEVTRGAVTKFDAKKSEATVLAIDYGNKEIVKLSNLFLMPRFALDYPRQCRTLALHGMPSNLDAATKEALNNHLKSTVQDKILQYELKDKINGVHGVVLTTEDSNDCINDLMMTFYESMKTTGHEKKIERIMLKDIPPQAIPEEPEFDVVITDVRSPACFSAQVIAEDKSNIVAMSNLFNQLQELPESSVSLSFDPVVNEVCLAFFSDDQTWSRAAVQKVNPDGTLRIAFIDYGNFEDLDPCYVRPITKELAKLPKQARKFSLFGVESSSLNGEWSEEAKKLFKDALFAESVCHASLISTNDETCSVELYLPSSKSYPYKMLLDRGLAVTAEPSNQIETKTTQSIPFALKLNNISAKGEHRVIPVHFENPHEFYVQIADTEKIHQVFEFDAIMQKVQVIPYTDLIVDDSCCALFSNGLWYRAKIVSVNGTDCEVYFYDYGNSATVPVKNLRVIPEEMRSLPGQAIRVKLNDVTPTGKDWSDEAKELMESNLSFQPCTLNVSKLEDGFVVGTLFRENDDADVAKMLVDANLARPFSAINGGNISTSTKNQKAAISSVQKQGAQSMSQTSIKRQPFTLSTEKLVSPSEQRVIPVHFENPHEFYVQIADTEKIHQVFEFHAIMQKVQVIPYTDLIVDDSCCALFSDGAWYRAKIVSVNGTDCEVYFYDYGNSATVPVKNLRVIPEEMRSLPGQAIRVKLIDVTPTGKDWSDEAKELMESNLSFQPCTLNVSKLEDGFIVGTLFRENDDANVAKMLVDANLARPFSSINGGNISTSTKNQKAAISSVQKQGAQSMSQTSIKRQPFTLSTEKLVSPTEQRVIPVHFENPHEFYIQIADPDKIHQVYEFDGIMQKVQVIPYTDLIVDDSCCALFSDGAWYRAKIVSVNGTDCEVYFYDYGNSATVPVKNLCVIPEEMRSLPGQAIRVKLNDVTPTGKDWSDEAKEVMESNLSFQPCTLMVLKTEGRVVCGKISREQDGLDICKELVNKGLARSASDMPSKTEKEFDEAPPLAEAPLPSTKSANYLEQKQKVPSKRIQEEEKAGIGFKKDQNRKDFNDKHDKNDTRHEPRRNSNERTSRIQNKMTNGRSRRSSDSERSSGDDGSSENNFHSQRAQKFAFQQNTRGRGRLGRRGRGNYQNTFRPQYPSNYENHDFVNQGPQNFMPPMFPFYPPYMFPPFMYEPNLPHPGQSARGSNNFSSESGEEGNGMADEYSKIEKRASFTGKRGQSFGRGKPPMRGRGQDLSQWMNAWHQVANYMNGNEAAQGYEAYRGHEATRGFGRGMQSFRGRGAINNMPRGVESNLEGAVKRYPRLPNAKTPASMYSGAEIECKVTCIEHPSHFYIKLTSDSGKVNLPEEVYEKAEFAENINSSKLVAAKVPGTSHFFRAIVENVFSKEKVLVRDVDSGLTEIVDRSGLKNMLPEDAKKPFRAIRCTLHNVMPKIRNRWSNEATKYLNHKLDVADRKVKICVRGENSFAVMISIRDPENTDVFIGEDMAQLGFAHCMR